MPLPDPCAPGPAPTRAAAPAAGMAATAGRRLLRQIMVVGPLCLGIALLLWVMDGGRFGVKLMYSTAIGASCTAIVEIVRTLLAALYDRLRAWRGLPPDASGGGGWRGVLPAALLAMVLGPSIGLWLVDLITGYQSPSLLHLGSASTRITLTLSLLGTAVAVLVFSTLERLARMRTEAEAARRAAAENQLRLLQSQLEPHMLFNTLANLRVLIGLDAAQAQAMLDRLISFLRATLNASRSPSQPLATEFAQLADYLALMRMRMGPRLEVRLDLPEELAQLPVPPLLLQPLVENAIKHGLEPKVQGGHIEVSARREGTHLLLAVRDTGIGLGTGPAATSGSRFGIEQVRARLDTLHGTQANLSLEPATDTRGGVLATVRMPLPAP